MNANSLFNLVNYLCMLITDPLPMLECDTTTQPSVDLFSQVITIFLASFSDLNHSCHVCRENRLNK